MKTDRLIGILSILLQKEKCTAPELGCRGLGEASASWKDIGWTEPF